jgi:tetratricopeptide (TPR) repeat protein
MDGLAYLDALQGNFEESETLLRDVLARRQQQLGPDDVKTAGSMHNLAVLFRLQGKYLEAQRMQEHAVEIGEKSLGPNHPSLAVALREEAEIFRAQGRYAEAEPLYKRASPSNKVSWVRIIWKLPKLSPSWHS